MAYILLSAPIVSWGISALQIPGDLLERMWGSQLPPFAAQAGVSTLRAPPAPNQYLLLVPSVTPLSPTLGLGVSVLFLQLPRKTVKWWKTEDADSSHI